VKAKCNIFDIAQLHNSINITALCDVFIVDSVTFILTTIVKWRKWKSENLKC